MNNDTTDFGFKKVNTKKKQHLVDEVFHSVANRYDLMNDVMSFGIHRLWKRHAVSLCQIRPHHHVLDLACGTGDLSMLIAPKVEATGKLTLCDINAAMLSLASKRLIDHGFLHHFMVRANAEMLPFSDNTFDRIIMGFGLRNVTFKDKALKNLYRTLKPSGRLIILEFSHPAHPVFSKLYDLYSFQVLPFLGKHIANDSESYRYLAESIRMHPNQETLQAVISEAGFDESTFSNLMGGVVAIHKGIKY